MINFTPELLNAALKKYVLKTKFTEKDEEYILKQSANIQHFNPERTLEYLIRNSEGRLDIYAPAGELLLNLRTLVGFPKNAEFLGIGGNRLNFEDSCWLHNDSASSEFLLKFDVPLCLYHNLKEYQDEVSIHLLKAYTNKLYRNVKNTLEYIPYANYQDMFNAATQNHAHLYTADYYNFIEYTAEEVYSTLSKFYDKENDQEFLTDLWEQLKITSQNIPVRGNPEYYKNVLIRFFSIQQFIQDAFNRYMHIFQSNPINKNFPHFRVIRVFDLNGMKYVFVKDLEFALINYENVKIEVETEKERKNGIIRTIQYHEFCQTLWRAGLTEHDIHIIYHTFPKTKHEVNVPIPTSYGTHCKLACDAFREVFRVFSLDINWFNTVSEKNYYKLIDWLNSISDIFSDTRKELYFIDVWKIDELKNQAYAQMKRYTRKPKYIPPNTTRTMTKEDIYTEIMKFGSNVKMNDECWKEVCLNEELASEMSKWDILEMYDRYCLFQVTYESNKIAKFLGNHFNQYVPHIDFPKFLKRESSMIHLAIVNEEKKKIEQIPKYYHKLDAHRVGFLNEYIYSMSTITSDCYYENETCLKLALDKTIIDESVMSKIISMVYEAEIQKFENQKRSVFFLTESEFYTFCEIMKRRFCDVMEHDNFTPDIESSLQSFSTKEEKLREIRRIWKANFPIGQYAKEFHESVIDIMKNEENCEEFIRVGLKARRIFKECSEEIRSFTNYCRMNKGRTIVMRMMNEIRIDNFEDWHMFSEEVLEAIEIVLENEGRLESMKEKIENWRKSWNYGENFSTITVKLFKTILNIVGIEASKFIFMPDVQFFKQYIDMPLKMGYNAMKILSPDGREVYHQSQAQFLIFQLGACDVFWNSENRKAKDKHKNKVLEEMSKIGKGYTLAKPVEQNVRRIMYSDVAEKTPLSAFHGKYHNQPLTEDEFRLISNCFLDVKIWKPDISSFLCKANHMFISRERFLQNIEDTEELNKNITKALTISFGFFYLKNMEGFEEWYSSDWENFGNAEDSLMEVIMSAKFKNESARNDFDVKELLQQHYLFDESDPLHTGAKEKKGKNRTIQVSRLTEKEEDVDVKLMNLFSEVIISISEKLSETTNNLYWQMFEDYIQKEFDEAEAEIMCKALKSGKDNEPMKQKLVEHLHNETVKNMKTSRKMMKESGKRVKTKKEEGPKVVVKYVTETKTIENCGNCRSIEKETMDFKRKIEDLEKELEKCRKDMKQNEEDVRMLKSQISNNKIQYREENQKHKEEVESRNAKIEQLNLQIKENCEDFKVQQETRNAEAQKMSEKAEDSVRKMKIELENSKFLENAKNKKMNEALAENEKLKRLLELCEENLAQSEKAREKAENRVKLSSDTQNKEAIPFGSKSEEGIFSNPELKKEDFNEILGIDVYGILGKISDVSKKYGVLKSGIVRFQKNFDMYIRILEIENCWEKAQIPEFPIPFSAEFIQEYERCLKEK